MADTIADLLRDKPEPVAVHEDTPVNKAVQLMIAHGYSQLPVVDEKKKPIGIVTSDSIIQALLFLSVTSSATLPVNQVMITRIEWCYLDADWLDVLDRIDRTPALLVINTDGTLNAVITPLDTTAYLRQRAQDIMLVQDIEEMIKDYIKWGYWKGGALDEAALESAVRAKHFPRNPDKFEQLTMHDYITLLCDVAHWPKYATVFPLDREKIEEFLHSIRETRNDLAHFRDITEFQRDQLVFCKEWLARHETALQKALGAESTEQPPAVLHPVTGPLLGLSVSNSRYAKLAIWLQNQALKESQITLKFIQIEEIIGGDLPPTARQHRSWWANDSVGHVQSRQWLEAGWRVSTINMSDETVTFARNQRD